MGRPALFIEMLSAVFQASVESGVVEDEPKNSEHAAAAYLCRMKITCRGAPWCTRPQAG